MSSLKYARGSFVEAPAQEAARHAAAVALRGASAMLARLSRRLAGRHVVPQPSDPRLEFYAEAGAPEGALYLDGELVGWVAGVQRL